MSKKTFADKFSKIKSKFFIIFWFFSIIYLGCLISPTVLALNSINELKESYFVISINSDHVAYQKVDSKPPGWVSIKDISKKLQYAIITSEDGTFFSHPGVDIDQLQSAINDSFVRKKKKKRGASTITQQMVKNIYLDRDRTFSRKLKEIFLSMYLETKVDKLKILEIYLNVIEYGKNIYGINNAAKFYFNKNSSQLTSRESAFVAMLLPSPVKYSRSFQKKCLSPFATKIIDSILLRMRQSGYIGETEYQEELSKKFQWETCFENSNINIGNEQSIEQEELDE